MELIVKFASLAKRIVIFRLRMEWTREREEFGFQVGDAVLCFRKLRRRFKLGKINFESADMRLPFCNGHHFWFSSISFENPFWGKWGKSGDELSAEDG